MDSENQCDIPQLVRPSQRSPSSASTFRAAVLLLSVSCRKTTATAVAVIGRSYFWYLQRGRLLRARVCVFFFLPSVCLSVCLAVCNSLVALRHGDSRLPEASPQRLRCSACSGYQLLLLNVRDKKSKIAPGASLEMRGGQKSWSVATPDTYSAPLCPDFCCGRASYP